MTDSLRVPLLQIDRFTATCFHGNPAAVCLLAAPAAEDWMQAVAAEMNLSETAFVVPRTAAGEFDLRWFTPTTEVDLCGHATLASCHALRETAQLAAGQSARFLTKSGWLTTTAEADDWISMDFPATPVTPILPPDGLWAALGLPPGGEAYRSQFDILIPVADADILGSIQPDMAALARIQARGIIVTAPSDQPKYDFLSRFFGPAVGVDEDPVTGSAHCSLAPYWAARLGKRAMTGYQASKRGGVVGAVLSGDRVILRGQAVTVFATTLAAPYRPAEFGPAAFGPAASAPVAGAAA